MYVCVLPVKTTSVVYRINGDIMAGGRALCRIIYIIIHYYLLARVYKNVVLTLSCQYSCSCLLMFLMLNSGLFIVIIREGPAYIVFSYLTLLIIFQTYSIWLPFPAPIGAMLDFVCLLVSFWVLYFRWSDIKVPGELIMSIFSFFSPP